jgi:hypothetical protein
VLASLFGLKIRIFYLCSAMRDINSGIFIKHLINVTFQFGIFHNRI